MHVQIDVGGNIVRYEFRWEEHDRREFTNEAGRPDGSVAATACRFVLPTSWAEVDTHPDVLAAVAVGLCGNLTAQRVTLSTSVSPHFQRSIARIWDIEIGPVDSSLPGRSPPTTGRPGLCFSGGVDSTAALLLLPDHAVSVFLDRCASPPRVGPSLYRKEAALHACGDLRNAGREVCVVPTNMEFLRKPVGFINHWTVAAPLMLVADLYALNSLTFGTVLESAYLAGGTRYVDYRARERWVRHAATTAAVGLPWNQVTAGLTEVATSELVRKSRWHAVAQSCVRGGVGAPCRNCWKCFRKGLLEAALRGDTLSEEELDHYFGIAEAQRHLANVPIKHENVILYILQQYRGNHPRMLELKQCLRPDTLNLGWVSRWFSPAAEVLAPYLRQDCQQRILQHFEPMTPGHLANVYAWDRIAANRAAGRRSVVATANAGKLKRR